MHEASLHEDNSFITLTYSPENLPYDQSIHKNELQKFFKRLRKNTNSKLRYFACGEYGEKNNRPHYHAIIFGYNFPDKYIHTKSNNHVLYRSPTLEKAWKNGHSLIGEVTFESAAYVARYVMKKRKGDDETIDPITGKTNKEYYQICDKETGEIHQQNSEFCIMSRKPGLGADWLQHYKSDTDKDYITLRGVKMKLPKFYDSILAMEDELAMLKRKGKRKRKALEQNKDNTFERLAVKKHVKQVQIKQLIRPIEALQ